jgi:D-alanyl-lipoteichoic acid acyltransferase DltB (MBOAT superfamily)
VYIPLGGNKKGFSKMQLNLMITFLISGLWHGANWTFVIWGFLHGSAVCIQNYIEHKKIKFRLNNYLSGLLLFSFVCFAWIFFRAGNLQAAILLLSNIFHPAGASEINTFFGSQIYLSRFAASLCLFVLFEIIIRNIKMQKWFNRIQRKWRWAFYYAIVFWIIYFGAFDNTPHFIYFQF